MKSDKSKSSTTNSTQKKEATFFAKKEEAPFFGGVSEPEPFFQKKAEEESPDSSPNEASDTASEAISNENAENSSINSATQEVQLTEEEQEVAEEEIQEKPIFESDTDPPEEEKYPTSDNDLSRIHLQADDSGGEQPTTALEKELDKRTGQGAPLSENIRSEMESSFQADFSGVRVHTDQQAAEMNQSLQAKAFTHGNDIYFNTSNYDTGSTEGKELLAHELTHTLQQGASTHLKRSSEGEGDKEAGNGLRLLANRFIGDPTLESVITGDKLLQNGSQNNGVRKVQQALVYLGYELPSYGVDGKYYGETQAIVEQFQRENLLIADGIVGPNTLSILDLRFIAEPAGGIDTTTNFIVPDPGGLEGPILEPGQAFLSDFVDQLETTICERLNEALANTGLTSDNCVVMLWFIDLLKMSTSAEMEELIRKFAPETQGMTDAAAVMQIIGEKTYQFGLHWVETGELMGLPADIRAHVPDEVITNLQEQFNLSFKALPGGARYTHTPFSVMRRLGRGHTMDSTSRSKMEGAFGSNFSDVEVHTSGEAVHLNREMNSRAFAVGKHVAFGQGEYQPRSLVGDALLAHELAHVEQQRRWDRPNESRIQNNNDRFLELEAEGASQMVMGKLLNAGSILPTEKQREFSSTGLSLQRCGQNVAPEYGNTIEDQEVSGKKLGLWKRHTGHGLITHELIGRNRILRAGNEEGIYDNSFSTLETAAAFAHVTIASRLEDGGVIIRNENEYKVYTIDVYPSRLLFNRKVIEEDYMTSSFIDTSKAQVSGVTAFVSSDGYKVPVNKDIKLRPNRLTPDAVPTEDISEKGYNQVLEDVQEGRNLNLSDEGYIALFKGFLKSNAIRQLEENKRKLDEEREKYQSNRSNTNVHWRRLRAVIRKDKAFAKRQRKRQGRISQINMAFGAALFGMPEERERELSEERRVLHNEVEEIKEYRARLRVEYPSLVTLKTDNIDSNTTNETLYSKIENGFEEIQSVIDNVKLRIHTEDIPLNKLGAIVTQTKDQMGVSEEKKEDGDPLSIAVIDWLEDNEIENEIITWTGTIVSFILGVAAIIASGGWAIFLGLAGSAVGAGTAVYEFERADDLYAAARVGEGSGGHLLNDPEAAKFNYIMGWVNLALAGLDLGIAARAASAVYKGGKIAEELVTGLGGNVLKRLKPEQITRFDEAMRLRQAGQTEAAQRILERLRSQLGDEVFLEAESLFSRASKAKQLFGNMSGVSEEAKRALINLDETILNRLPSLGSTSIDNIGRFIHRQGTDAAILLNNSGDDILGLAARAGGEIDDIFRVFKQTPGNLRQQFFRLIKMSDVTLDLKREVIQELGKAISNGKIPIDDLTGLIAGITRARGGADQILLNTRQALSELHNAQRVVREGLVDSVRLNAVMDEVYDLGSGVNVTINPMHEVDALFLRRGTIIAHEVKDTMTALLNKLREGGQLKRMRDWKNLATSTHPRAIKMAVENERGWTGVFSTVSGRNNVAETLGKAGVPLRIGNFEFSPIKLLELHDAMNRYWISLGRPRPPATFFSRPELQDMAEALKTIGLTL